MSDAKEPRVYKMRAPRTVKHGWEDRFIEALSNSGNVRASCLAAGISRELAYNRRKISKPFAQRWAWALEDAVDTVEAIAWQRAMSGQSDQIIMFILKSRRREIYGDQIRVQTEAFRSQVEKLANDMGLDVESVMAEAEALLKEALAGD